MLKIRSAAPRDALGITIVNVYTWKTTYRGLIPEEMIDARISDAIEIAKRFKTGIERGDGFLVAVEEGTIVGFCGYGASRNEDFADAGEIYGLYVLKGFQGMGVGRKLFSAAVKMMADMGYSSMIINCLSGNPSLGFYNRMGGVVVGRRNDETRDGHILTEDILYFTDIRNTVDAEGNI